MAKRKLDILVLSDIHLGTFGCRAVELLEYLRTVKPRVLILNGDIIDMWNFRRSHFPSAHWKVVKRFMKYAERIPVYYITGNHDEALRRFDSARLGNLRMTDKLTMGVDGKTFLFFHGDIFDATMKARWLAKIGGVGYDMLIRLNHVINNTLDALGQPRMSLSKRVKNSVKQAVMFINDFEQSAADFAARQECSHVVCGHIHQPKIRVMDTERGPVTYLNSGDWIENMSALEYARGEWRVHHHGETAQVEHPIVPLNGHAIMESQRA